MKKFIILIGMLLLLVFSVSASCVIVKGELEGDCPEGTGDFYTIGFWKHQFAVHVLGRGHAQVGLQDLLDMLGEIRKTVFEGLELNTGYYMLWLKHMTMQQRSQQQCFATMLNWASGAVNFGDLVDTDYDGEPDTQFYLAMDEFLYTDDYESAKNICDSINNMNY